MKSRNFTLTLWLHVTERCWEEILSEFVSDGTLRFVAYGEETCPDTGTLHYQAYCCFHNKRSVNGVRAMFPQCHVEVMQGSLRQNEDYCSKEGSFTKLGDEPKQGERSDIIGIRDRIVAGERPMKIAKTTTNSAELETVARFNRFFTEMHRECSWDSRVAEGFSPPKTYLRIGDQGVGKSTHVYELHGYENIWVWNSTMGKFFDGYRGEPVVIFEDVQKGEIPPLKFFNQLLDGYPMRVSIKCDPQGATWNAKTIYITSNEEPQYWYDYANPTHHTALMSRIFQGVRVYKDRPEEVFHTSSRFHASVQEEEVHHDAQREAQEDD